MFKLRTTSDGSSNYMGTVKDFQVMSCAYPKDKREASKAVVRCGITSLDTVLFVLCYLMFHSVSGDETDRHQSDGERTC